MVAVLADPTASLPQINGRTPFWLIRLRPDTKHGPIPAEGNGFGT
ncbi:hypothetical protein ACFQU2_39810 [Siccirubricoccus deserti]